MAAIAERRQPQPWFFDGFVTQAVLDAESRTGKGAVKDPTGPLVTRNDEVGCDRLRVSQPSRDVRCQEVPDRLVQCKGALC